MWNSLNLGSWLRTMRGDVLAVAEVPLTSGTKALRLTLKKLKRSNEPFVVVSMNGSLQYDIQWLAMKDFLVLADEVQRLKALAGGSEGLRPQPVGATLNPGSDTLTIQLADAIVQTSQEVHPGIVVGYDCDHRIVTLDILRARQNLPAARRVDRQYQSSL